MNHINHFIPILPEIIILLGACLGLLTDIFFSHQNNDRTIIVIQLTIIIAVVITSLQLLMPEATVLNGNFICDHLSSTLKLFIYLIGFVSLYLSNPYYKNCLPSSEYPILILFSILGMMVLVSSNNLITLYMALELVSLPLYTIIAMQHQRCDHTPEAAIKFFVMGAIASGLLLYGISMIYGATGHLNIPLIASSNHQFLPSHLNMLRFGLIFVIAGVAFKLGATPFHSWMPDVYQGSPWPVTLFIGTASKIAALGMTIRLLINMLPGLSHDWQLWLTWIAIASMTLGNLQAIVQTNIKRLFAYSAIAQVGYMLLGFLCGTPQGYDASIFYMITYVITAFGAFLLLTLLSIANGSDYEQITKLKGLNNQHPWIALMMLLSLFSMAGVPPFAGFIAKITIIEALLASHQTWLACISLLLSVIGVYYYLKIIKVMYFQSADNHHRQPYYLRQDLLIIVSFVTLLPITVMVYPNFLLSICHHLLS